MKKYKIIFVAIGFLSANFLFAQSENHQIIKNFFNKNLRTSNQLDFRILNEDESKSMKGTVVNVQQTYNGLEIFNASATFFIKNNEVQSVSNQLNTKYIVKQNNTGKKSFEQIISKIKDKHNIKLGDFSNTVELKNDIVVKRNKLKDVFYNQDNTLIKSTELEFDDVQSGNRYLYIIDDSNGNILYSENLTISCAFLPNSYHHENHEVSSNSQQSFTSSAIISPDDASYLAYPLPYENPLYGNRSALSNPWLVSSSPEGWHYGKSLVLNGGTLSLGNEYRSTKTFGNNVYAYEDLDGVNSTTGTFADGGANRNFSFNYNQTLPKDNPENVSASITNLFYVSNMSHDIFYKFGFTETAKNFQRYNFGKGGVEIDEVLAEARDGGGTNNANFSTSSDGSAPRMQMYLWDPAIVNRLFYNTPDDFVSRKPNTKNASYGPQLNTTGITADLKYAPTNGCTAFDADYFTNSIAVIERGGCTFKTKTLNAQNAGAVAVIVRNVTDSSTFGTMGDDTTITTAITIPTILVDNAEGEAIKNKIATTTINATLRFSNTDNPQLDGSFDNGIVIHEYGHGVSNRMTNRGYSCLNSSLSKEQMGEGWSDFFALMLTNKPGDDATVARGIGAYASGQNIDGPGIRARKYSPNFAINEFTYGKTNGMEYQTTNTSGQVVIVPDVHAIGHIWATILWDLHWKYVEKYGYASDVVANPNSGSAKVLQLVMDGIKLQECSPTFLSGRDAILQADVNSTGGQNKCMIWQTFAKRGVGVKASAGSKTDINDQVQDFTVPTDCILSTNEIVSQEVKIFPNPAKNEFFLKIPNAVGSYAVDIFDVSGRKVLEDKIRGADNRIYINNLPNGIYIISIKGNGVNYSHKLIVKK